MNKILASGMVFGIQYNFECVLKNGRATLQGEGVEYLQWRFNRRMKSPPAMAGTYFPRRHSLMAAYSVLVNDFFDAGTTYKVEVIGDIGTIPYKYEEGAIY